MTECTCTIAENAIGRPLIQACNLCKAAPKMLDALRFITLGGYFDLHGYGTPEEQEDAAQALIDVEDVIREAEK